MKIRNKITLIFVLLSGSLLALVFLVIFTLASSFTERQFYLRLRERAVVVAKAYFEQDELGATVYSQVRIKHYQVLPNEREEVVKVNLANQTLLDSLEIYDYSPEFLEAIFEEKSAEERIEHRFCYGMLYSDDDGDYFVIVTAEDKYGQAKLRNLKQILIITGILAVFVIFLTGQYYSGRILKPIGKIAEQANRISVSNMHLRLDPGENNDELSELAILFNEMLDRLENSFSIQHNFINNASHELRNPLTVILGEAEIALMKERSPETYVVALQNIQKEATRLELLVTSLLKLSQTGSDRSALVSEPIAVVGLLKDVIENMKLSYPNTLITANFSSKSADNQDFVINGSKSLLSISVANVIDNACKFSQGKEVQVTIHEVAGEVQISVRDQGVGIPKSELKNILEPFYRAANVRNIHGFGVGLALAYKIVKIHGGTIKVQSELDHGTLVTISLPSKSRI